MVRERFPFETEEAHALRNQLLTLINHSSRSSVTSSDQEQCNALMLKYSRQASHFAYLHMQQAACSVVFGDHKKAIETSFLAEKEIGCLAREHRRAASRMTYLNLANTYWELGDLKKARQYVDVSRSFDASPAVLLTSITLRLEEGKFSSCDEADLEKLAAKTPQFLEWALNHPSYPLAKFKLSDPLMKSLSRVFAMT